MKLHILTIIISFSCIFCIFYNNAILAKTLVYKETTGSKSHTNEITISSASDGYLIKTTNIKETTEHNIDSKFALLMWKYKTTEKETDINSKRVGNVIYTKGMFEGEQIEKELKVDKYPWYQEWGLSLESFITSDKKSTYFWSINPDNLAITKFIATKEKTETIKVNGEKVETIYVKITFPGLLSLVWHGDFWFRNSDGREVCSKLKQSPFACQTVSELINEK